MNRIDKWVKEVAAYGCVGGLAGLPMALSESPWIYPAMLLPLALSGVQIRRLVAEGHTLLATMALGMGPYIGAGCVFHLVHGEWDYQGVVMALIGSTVVVPVLYAIQRETIRASVHREGDPESMDP